MLHAIEGHLTVGYDDGGDAPDKQLALVPGAAEDAAAFLADHPDTRARFDRVSALVEGFESPFGLELLATVHWVMKREEVHSLEDVTARTYAWNERKRQFTPRQIGIAVERLSSMEWAAESGEQNLRSWPARQSDESRQLERLKSRSNALLSSFACGSSSKERGSP